MKYTQNSAYLVFLLLLLPFLFSCGNISPGQEFGNISTPPSAETKMPAPAKSSPSPQLPTVTIRPVSAIKVTPEELNGVEIQFWYSRNGNIDETLAQLVEQFNVGNEWKIKVEATSLNGIDELDTEVSNAILTTGNIPDLTTGYIYQARNWNAIRDIVVDLNAYVQDPIWGIQADEISDFYPEFWDSDLISSTRWALPAWRSGKVIFYNQTWGRELGFSAPPTTPEQFIKQACAATKAYLQTSPKPDAGRGGWIISTDFSSTIAWMYAFGGNILKPDGAGYNFDTPQVTKTFQFLRKLFDDQCAWLPESQVPVGEFAARDGLMMTGSIIDLPRIGNYFTQSGNPDEWTVIPFPTNEDKPIITVYGPSYVIFHTSPQRELAAWLFVKWLLKTENQIQLAKAGNTFPLRRSVVKQLENDPTINPAWQASFDLIPYVRDEPNLGSWEIVRWAVSDAHRQIYQWYFKADQIPSLVRLLNETVNSMPNVGK